MWLWLLSNLFLCSLSGSNRGGRTGALLSGLKVPDGYGLHCNFMSNSGPLLEPNKIGRPSKSQIRDSRNACLSVGVWKRGKCVFDELL